MNTRWSSGLLVSVLALSAHHAGAEDAGSLVEGVRGQENGFDAAKAFVITTGDDCVPKIVQSGAEIDGPISLTSGEGAIIELCTSGGEHYFTAPELFQSSAFWKAETPTGYIEADIFSACEVFPNADSGCCAMYFVPVLDGAYTATDERCAGVGAQGNVELTVSGQEGATLEQATDSAWTQPALQDDAGVDASSGDWAGWEDPLFIEITLVENPECDDASSGRRRLQQAVEGGEGEMSEGLSDFVEGGEGTMSEGATAEQAEGQAPQEGDAAQEGDAGSGSGASYMWVYTGGWTSQSTPLVKDLDDVDREEGATEGSAGVMDAATSEQGTATINAVSAQQHPIEMIVGQGYILSVAMLRPSADHYFSAPAFFQTAVVRKIQDNTAEAKFQTYPTHIELFDDRGTFEIYVVPTVVGDYPFSRSDDSDDAAAKESDGVIRVLASKDELSDSATLENVPVYQGSC